MFCNHVLTPPAIRGILEHPDIDGLEGPKLDGFIGPAHVSAVIGTDAFAEFAAEFKKPVVVAGFEPLDVMQSILMLIHQVNDGRHDVENQYVRAVTGQGNQIAQAEVATLLRAARGFRVARLWPGAGQRAAAA